MTPEEPLPEAPGELIPETPAEPPVKPPPTKDGFSDGISPADPDYWPVKILMNVAEHIALLTQVGDASYIKRVLNIPDPIVLPKETRVIVRRAVRKMQDTKDPEVVLGLIDELQNAGIDTIDPMGAAFFKAGRANAYENAIKLADGLGPLGGPVAAMVQTAFTPISMNRTIPARDADAHVRTMGISIRMGRKRLTSEDMKDLRRFEERMWDADTPLARDNVLRDFQETVLKNLEADGRWKEYKEFEGHILQSRAAWVKHTFPDVKMEAYGAGDSRVLPSMRGQHAEVAESLRKAKAAEDLGNAGEAALWRLQAEELQKRIKKTQDAARIYTDAQKNPEKYRAKNEKGLDVVDERGDYAMNDSYNDAVKTLHELGREEPVWMYQLKQKLTVDKFDPRLLAWFQSGKPWQAFMRYDTLVADPIIRLWKKWTLAGIAFPLRVYAGDEFWRLPMEGIGPLEYKAARAVVAEMRGDISRSERKTLKELREKKDLTKSETDQLAALEEKSRPKVPDDVLEFITQKQDFVDADFGAAYDDYWQFMGPKKEANGTWALPNDSRYIPSVQRIIKRFSEEPVVRMLLERDDWTKDTAKQAIHALLVDAGESGVALRHFLHQTERITLPMVDPKNLARVITRPSAQSHRHIANLVDEWADTYVKMQRSPEMLEGLRKGSIDQHTLETISPELMPTVPVGHFDMMVKHPYLRYLNFGPLVYDRITLPLMEKLGGRVRDALFGQEYLKQRDAILAKHPDFDPQTVMEQAAGRAAHYVERTTYTRNATVFEDMVRNHILFINSYRQFWTYWLTKMVTRPVTMAAIWNEAPERGDEGMMGWLAQNMSSFMPFFLQSRNFEDSRVKTPAAMAKAIAQPPGPSPMLSPILGTAIRYAFDTDPALLPGGASMGEGMQPLQKLGVYSKGLLNINMPWAKDNARSHAILSAWEKETVDLDDALGPDGVGERALTSNLPQPFASMAWVRDMVNKHGPDFLEDRIFGDPVATSEMVQSFIGVPNPWVNPKPPIYTEYTAEAAEYYELKEKGKPAEAAKFLENSKYLRLVKEFQTTSDSARRSEILMENDWVGPLATSNYIYDGDGAFLFDEDWERTDNPLALWKYRETLRKQYGGYKLDPETGQKLEGESGTYVGDINRRASIKKIAAHEKDIVALAKKAAREHATVNGVFYPRMYEDDMAEWTSRTGKEIKDGKWNRLPDSPQWYDDYISRHKKELSKGMPKDWTVHAYWHPTEYADQATLLYKTEFDGENYVPDDQRVEFLLRLDEQGLLEPKEVREAVFAKGTAIGAVARRVDREALLAYRKDVLDVTGEAWYALDQKTLNRIGYDFDENVNNAIKKVRVAYYAKMGNREWVEKYGTSSSEYRDARNEFYRYKDKVFGSIRGGEAFVGGVPERILRTPFLVGDQSMTFTGDNAYEDTRLWQAYIREARKANPNINIITGLRSRFSSDLAGRMGGQQAAVDWVAVASAAKAMRHIMKTSYSEYYQDVGNSVYSNAGQAMVAKLEKFIITLVKKKNGKRTTFGRDLKDYGWSAHSLAYDMLEWYYH